MSCKKISVGIPLDCDTPAVAGVNDRLILFNFDDKGSITKDANNPLAVTAISLASPALAYAFEGQNNSNEPVQTAVKQGFQLGYNHQLTFRVFNDDADTKKVLNDIGKGRLIAIVQNNTDTFEIYGYETGLIVPDGGITRTLNDPANNGGYVIQLGTDTEITQEPFLPYSYVGTSSPYDFATAKADIDALL